MYQFLVWDLLQPFTLFYLLVGVAILNLWRRRAETRRRLLWLTAAYGVLFLLGLEPVSHSVTGSLEWQNAPLRERPADVGAIVVLASSVQAPDQVRLFPELDEDSCLRCLEAARIYRLGQSCPVVISGNVSDEGSQAPACSEAMRNFLVQLGVSSLDIIVEKNSLTTYENAVESRKLLDARSIRKVLVLTDATHLPRATACFRKQGLQVVPCGCRYRATRFEIRAGSFVPNLEAVKSCGRAGHEWLGIAWYWLRGRI